MVDAKYIDEIRAILKENLAENERVFIFGSSVDSENFADIDLAIVSEKMIESRRIGKMREALEESKLPYKFDVVDINNSNDPFRTKVLEGSKIWII